MIKCISFLQEGQIPEHVIELLDRGIRNIVAANDLGKDVEINWIVVPHGQGWTAGAPSTSSVITLTAPPIEQSQRVEILHALCDLWTENTGCRADEVLATVIPAA